MHLDARAGFVVEGDVRPGLGEEIAADQAVHVVEDVAVERRGNAGRIRVGAHQPRGGLLRVDADQKPAPRTRDAVHADALEEFARVVGREVADRRPRIEERGRTRVEIRLEVEAFGEIDDDAADVERRKRVRDPAERVRELILGDIDRDVARGRGEREPVLRLAAIACPEVDPLAPGSDGAGDGRAVLDEDRALGARRIVLGQFADRAVERAAQAIVEVPGRDRGRVTAQALDERVPLAFRVGVEPLRDASVRHVRSRSVLGGARARVAWAARRQASLRPEAPGRQSTRDELRRRARSRVRLVLGIIASCARSLPPSPRP